MAKRTSAVSGKRARTLEASLLALVASVASGCGDATRLGVTGEGGGAGSNTADGGGGSGGGSTPRVVTGGSAGAPCNSVPDCNPSGGAAGGHASGGRSSTGGAFGTGGRATTGGASAADADVAPNPNRVPAGQVCARLAEIQCAAERNCCPSTAWTPDCEVQKAFACRTTAYLDALSEIPRFGYDIDRAEAAFTEFEKRAFACDPDIVTWAISNAGFRAVGRGTVPAGGDCLTQIDDGGTASVIAYWTSCTNPETMACLGTPTWTCEPRSGTGGPCSTDLNCLDGFFCDMRPPGGKCAERFPDGASCNDTGAPGCRSLFCNSDRICAPRTVQDAYCSSG